MVTAIDFEPRDASGRGLNGARWYDARVGRWLSKDPEGLTADADPYTYAGNSPTNAVDPNGLAPVPGGSGVGVWTVINGKIGWRYNETDFFITGTPQAGMWQPKTGSTSYLFVYRVDNPRKVYRLDYDVLKSGPNAGNVGWEHNVEKVAKVLDLEDAGIRQHAPAGTGAIAAGKTMKIFRWLGKPLLVINAADSALAVYHAQDKVRAIVTQGGGWAASVEGASVGGRAGAWAGGELGALTGIGAVPLAAVGAVGGSILGGIAGFAGGSLASSFAYNAVFVPLQSETWIEYEPPCEGEHLGEGGSYGKGGSSGGGGGGASW